jgi:hypothetical protein
VVGAVAAAAAAVMWAVGVRSKVVQCQEEVVRLMVAAGMVDTGTVHMDTVDTGTPTVVTRVADTGSPTDLLCLQKEESALAASVNVVHVRMSTTASIILTTTTNTYTQLQQRRQKLAAT